MLDIMDGSTLRNLIGQKRPKYKTQYRALIDSISKKGDSSGKGVFPASGTYYQACIYVFVDYKSDMPKYIERGEQTEDFVSFVDWKLMSIRGFMLILLLNESEKYNFSWLELENANQEAVEAFATDFKPPFVIVNFLEELNS
jgi:hypothetical protein